MSFSQRLATKEEADRYREETENRRRFRALADHYVLVCEELADREQDEVKKTSQRRSKRKRRPRSKR